LAGTKPELEQGEESVPHAERIEDPVRVFKALAALFQHRAVGRLQHSRGTATVVAEALDEGAQMLTWRVEDAGALGGGPFLVELTGLNFTFHFHVPQGFARGDSLLTPMPSSLLRLRRRRLRRVDVVSHLGVSFALGETRATIAGNVRDISYEGLAFELPSAVDSLGPGTRLDRVRVFGDADRASSVAAHVRWVVPLVGGGSRYGVRILAAAEPRRFIELVDEHIHADTRVGGAWAEYLWELYERCGYFNLSGKEPAAFERRRSAFVRVAQQLDDAPHLGFHVVWPRRDPRGATAALSALKIYDRTWLGFQMSKMKGDVEGAPGRKILREIHLRTYETIQRDPDAAWIIAYPQVKRVWSAQVHLDLPARYVDRGEAEIVRFRALEITAAQPWTVDGPVFDPLEIGCATAAELSSLALELASLRSRIYLDALDLVPERMTLDANRRLWNRAELLRDRQVLVARRDGQVVAAAVLEVAAEGAHLFGLLDLVRLYAIERDGERHFPALLDAAKSWFRSHDKSRFVCFLEEGTILPEPIVAETEDLGEADMTILSAHRIPELLEHLYEVTAPRPGT
jgi:hypothetical protein